MLEQIQENEEQKPLIPETLEIKFGNETACYRRDHIYEFMRDPAWTDKQIDSIENHRYKPIYTRAEVLREGWKPKYHSGMLGYDILGESCFRIGSDNRINYITSGCALGIKDWVFAPTRELAEEIVAIREGKWLPKKGDVVFDLKPKLQLPILRECNGYVAGKDYLPSEWKYFPSEAQRTRYIADKLNEKQKAKEAKSSFCEAVDTAAEFVSGVIKEAKQDSGVAGYEKLFHSTPCPDCKRENPQEAIYLSGLPMPGDTLFSTRNGERYEVTYISPTGLTIGIKAKQ